ncbi:hypothetical protein B0H19DRAFT_1024484 [Mycena capillaripes]|nr:hypothetical protein B0H19DRAFT_1024484 [Mycena capillaripes]
MSPYYGPVESASDIALERMFVAGDLVTGTGFGVQFALYFFCFRYLWQRRKQHRYAIFVLVYITTLFSVEFLFVAVQAQTVQMIYIDNRNYPGGPWAFFLATQNAPVNIIFYVTLFMLTFLSDLLVIWRCWVIWAAEGQKKIAYLVISFPCILLLASFALGVLWTLESSKPGLSLYSRLPIEYGTAYYTISLSVNIIISTLIIARLLFYRRRLLKILPTAQARHYVSMMTIVVESAVLYSAFALLFLITYAVNNPTTQLWLGVASATQQISGYLIVCRLADGSAWRVDTMRFSSIVRSGLQFPSIDGESAGIAGPPHLKNAIDLEVNQVKGGDILPDARVGNI